MLNCTKRTRSSTMTGKLCQLRSALMMNRSVRQSSWMTVLMNVEAKSCIWTMITVTLTVSPVINAVPFLFVLRWKECSTPEISTRMAELHRYRRCFACLTAMTSRLTARAASLCSSKIRSAMCLGIYRPVCFGQLSVASYSWPMAWTSASCSASQKISNILSVTMIRYRRRLKINGAQ